MIKSNRANGRVQAERNS